MLQSGWNGTNGLGTPNLGDFYLMLCNNLMLSNVSSHDVICFIEISVTYAKMENDILLKITHERKLNSP